jgi:hypothetical protein
VCIEEVEVVWEDGGEEEKSEEQKGRGENAKRGDRKNWGRKRNMEKWRAELIRSRTEWRRKVTNNKKEESKS